MIRRIPENFGKAQQPGIYAAIAEACYVPQLSPEFAYVHWRDEYELSAIEHAYERAHALTRGFIEIEPATLAAALRQEPCTLRIFRLFLGLTTQEFAASTLLVAAEVGTKPLTNSAVKAMEGGRPGPSGAAEVAAAVIDRAIRGTLFAEPTGDVRSKIAKPDTMEGWSTVQKYAKDGVPFHVFLHQRHYGGAFRQLLDATSSKRGDVLEQAVEDLFTADGIHFVRTGPNTQAKISKEFGLTVKPAPDFVVHDADGSPRAILECKQANDGGTARDKAARFQVLRNEAMRLGGLPVFAVLGGLGWQRTADALGPVVRDTDGRVFTVKTLPQMMGLEPFQSLRGDKAGSNRGAPA